MRLNHQSTNLDRLMKMHQNKTDPLIFQLQDIFSSTPCHVHKKKRNFKHQSMGHTQITKPNNLGKIEQLRKQNIDTNMTNL